MGIFDDIGKIVGSQHSLLGGVLGSKADDALGGSTPIATAGNAKLTPEQIQSRASSNANSDISQGSDFASRIVGDGLERLSGNSSIEDIRKRLTSAAEGDNDQTNLRRSIALNQLQGQQSSSSRQLSGSLGRSGVRGGAAAAAELQLQAQALNARGNLESSLALQRGQEQAAATNNLANFAFKTAQFDISQGEKEKALNLQAQLGFSNLVSNERNAIRQQEAASLIAAAEASKQSGGKK